MAKMRTESSAQDVLRLFATYGFRKVSMGDIAKAADLSRQSIYNQFGSKDAVLEWAVTAFLDDVTNTSVQRLQSVDGDPSDTLSSAYQAWIGDHVPLLRGTEHGGELLETAMTSAAKASRDYEGEFDGAVRRFLMESGVCATQSEAKETAFVLGAASKGLLLKSETSESYATNIRRVIEVLLERAR